MNESVAVWPWPSAWKAATPVGSYTYEPSALTVTMAPLASVTGVPTFAGAPFTAVTVRISPRSGSTSLPSTPGAGTVSTVSSSVVPVSAMAVGGSFTGTTVMVNVTGADWLTPPLAVPPLSCSTSVIVAMPLANGAGVYVNVPSDATAGWVLNRAVFVLPVTLKVSVCAASSAGPALIAVAHARPFAGRRSR